MSAAVNAHFELIQSLVKNIIAQIERHEANQLHATRKEQEG
jgi:hypothetical protein